MLFRDFSTNTSSRSRPLILYSLSFPHSPNALLAKIYESFGLINNTTGLLKPQTKQQTQIKRNECKMKERKKKECTRRSELARISNSIAQLPYQFN